jgi:O-antigen ligase
VVLVWSIILLARGLEQGRAGAASIALALLGTIPILLTGSKLVWGCTFIGFGYVAVRWAADHGRWRVLLAGSMVALVAASTAAATVARERLSAFAAEMAQVIHSGGSHGLSVGNRLELAVSGWRAFLDRPLLGYGFAERMEAARHHATPGGPDTSMHFHLHNDYITHLVSFGIFGLVFILAYLGFYLQLAARMQDAAYRNSGIAIVVALALYMGFEIAFNMDPVSGLMAVHIGILLAFARHRDLVAVATPE